MQSLRNAWIALKALGAILLIGAVAVAIPMAGILLAIGLTLVLMFALLVEFLNDDPKDPEE